MATRRTGFVYDPRFLDHDTGPGHPERPERLTATMAHLEALPWFPALTPVASRPAPLEAIEAVHSAEYIRRAEAACREGEHFLDVPDVAISPQSFEVARLAAGSAMALGDALISGDIDNGFALLRPPGHHAEYAMALGFCIFNNVAILARHLQRAHGLERIAIVDWDVHHGNGTQHSFEDDPSVLYCSTHQYPYYPGTGAASERGRGAGEGTVVNCPLPAGSGDAEYRAAFTERILPAVDAFAADAVLISAGFDAHREDPLAQMQLGTGFYAWATDRLLELAAAHAHGRVLSLLEGGYSLRALPECVAAHLARLAGVD